MNDAIITPAPAAPAYQPAKILLIEDNYDTLRLMSAMLQRGGFQIFTAESGEQGVAMASEVMPDLILCDIMMPGMDGQEVLRVLRGQSDTATIPFVFLTAMARHEDVRQGMELGADDYLTKPIQASALLNAVNSRLTRHQQLQTSRLEAFTQRMVFAQESQREQMAYRLENDVNQSLRSLQFILNLMDAPRQEDVALFGGARELLGGLIEKVEGLSQEMHPTMLGRLGLVPALRWLTEQYDVVIAFETDEIEYAFAEPLKICLFRLVQESLNNVVRHAQAEQVKVTLKYAPPFVELRVEDDGVGFDLEQTLQSVRSMGLQQMYSLVAWQKGELHITSAAGEGTAVYALLPQAETNTIADQSVSRRFLRRLASRAKSPTAVSASSGSVKIVLAMEQALQRQGLRRLLQANTQFQVLGEVQELDQAVPVIEKHKPQLVIINPIAAGKNAREVLQTITQACPDTAVLVISSATHDEYVIAALESGAHGYIPNNATITDMNTAIMRVSQKEHYLSPDLNLDLARWQDSRPRS